MSAGGGRAADVPNPFSVMTHHVGHGVPHSRSNLIRGGGVVDRHPPYPELERALSAFRILQPEGLTSRKITGMAFCPPRREGQNRGNSARRAQEATSASIPQVRECCRRRGTTEGPWCVPRWIMWNLSLYNPEQTGSESYQGGG